MTVTPEMIAEVRGYLADMFELYCPSTAAENIINKVLAMSQASPPPQTVERLIDEQLSRLPPEHDRTEYAEGKFDGLTELRAALSSCRIGTDDE